MPRLIEESGAYRTYRFTLAELTRQDLFPEISTMRDSRLTEGQFAKMKSLFPEECEAEGTSHIVDLQREAGEDAEGVSHPYMINEAPTIVYPHGVRHTLVNDFSQFIGFLFPAHFPGPYSPTQERLAAWFLMFGGQSLIHSVKDGLVHLRFPYEGEILDVYEYHSNVMGVQLETLSDHAYEVNIQYAHKAIQVFDPEKMEPVFLVQNKQGRVQALDKEYLKYAKAGVIFESDPNLQVIQETFDTQEVLRENSNGEMEKAYLVSWPTIVNTTLDVQISENPGEAFQVEVLRFENTVSSEDLHYPEDVTLEDDKVSEGSVEVVSESEPMDAPVETWGAWFNRKWTTGSTYFFGQPSSGISYAQEDLRESMNFKEFAECLNDQTPEEAMGRLDSYLSRELSKLYPYQSDHPLRVVMPTAVCKENDFAVEEVPSQAVNERLFKFTFDAKMFLLFDDISQKGKYAFLSKQQQLQYINHQAFEKMASGVRQGDTYRKYLSDHCHRIDDDPEVRTFGLDPLMTLEGFVKFTEALDGTHKVEFTSCRLKHFQGLDVNLGMNRFGEEEYEAAFRYRQTESQLSP